MSRPRINGRFVSRDEYEHYLANIEVPCQPTETWAMIAGRPYPPLADWEDEHGSVPIAGPIPVDGIHWRGNDG